MTGSEYLNNRVCHSPKAFKIRDGVEAKIAFKALQKNWSTKALKKSDLEKFIFKPSDDFIKNYASNEGKGADPAKLISAAQPVRNYILKNSDAFYYESAVGSIAWFFVLDAKNEMMYQFAIFMED